MKKTEKTEIKDEKVISICQQLLNKVEEAIPTLTKYEMQSVEKTKSVAEVDGQKVETVREVKSQNYADGYIDRGGLKDLCQSLKTLKEVADGLSPVSREEKELKVKALRKDLSKETSKDEIMLTILADDEMLK